MKSALAQKKTKQISAPTMDWSVKRLGEERAKGQQTYRGLRCGLCYGAKYDGNYCQNPDCELHLKTNQPSAALTQGEAFVLIAATRKK